MSRCCCCCCCYFKNTFPFVQRDPSDRKHAAKNTHSNASKMSRIYIATSDDEKNHTVGPSCWRAGLRSHDVGTPRKPSSHDRVSLSLTFRGTVKSDWLIVDDLSQSQPLDFVANHVGAIYEAIRCHDHPDKCKHERACPKKKVIALLPNVE